MPDVHWVQDGIFALVALGMTGLAAARHREAAALRHARDVLERRIQAHTQQLLDANDALEAQAEVRKTTEQALLQLAAIELSTEDAMFALGLSGAIVSCNPGAERMFGNTAAQLASRPFARLLRSAAAAELPQLLARVSRGESIQPFETVPGRASGTRMHLLLSLSPIKDAAGSVHGVCALVRDITRRKRAERRIALYQQHLRWLATSLSLAEQRERRRIAIELHDHLAQMLILSRMKIRMMQASRISEDATKPMEEIRLLLDQSIDYTRTLIWDLCPPILHDIGLEPALEWLTEQFQERHGIQVRFDDDDQPKPSDENVRILLFQAVHELLLNVIKHASASKAIVGLRRCGEEVEIRVEDDGIGFDLEEARVRMGRDGGFGLFSIRERLAVVGGSFEMSSHPGTGSQATLRAPLHPGAAADTQK